MHWANWSSLLLQTVKQSVSGALKKGSTLSFFCKFSYYMTSLVQRVVCGNDSGHSICRCNLIRIACWRVEIFIFLLVFEDFLGTQCRKVAVVAVEDTWLRNADAEGRCAHLRCLSKLKTKNEIMENACWVEKKEEEAPSTASLKLTWALETTNIELLEGVEAN